MAREKIWEVLPLPTLPPLAGKSVTLPKYIKLGRGSIKM